MHEEPLVLHYESNFGETACRIKSKNAEFIFSRLDTLRLIE